MKDTEQRLKFIRLRAQGQSLSTIASQLGVARQTLANLEDALEEEVQNMKAMELDALREAYFMTKKARIEDIATSDNGSAKSWKDATLPTCQQRSWYSSTSHTKPSLRQSSLTFA